MSIDHGHDVDADDDYEEEARRIMVAAKLMEHLILTQAQPILQSYKEEPQSDWS